jgi:DNA-binding NarL/FixJ family response regulator
LLQTIVMRILIVEDEEHLGLLLAEVLEREGHAVKTASDGRSGLTRALREGFDLLVVDWVRLGDSEFVLADPENEARGKDVYDAAGQRIGGVEVGAGSFLGLLGEEYLIPTLTRRPDLRWLADEEGARWAVLTELGRISEPEAFEEALQWALENRPSSEEAKDYIRRFRFRRQRGG